MKLIIKKDEKQKEPIITIHYATQDEKMTKLIEIINNFYLTIVGKLDNEDYILNLDDIYYFEAVDNRVFAYSLDKVYEVSYKILELTSLLKETPFLQTSRTVILNISKITKVSQLVNGRMLAMLDNKEKIIISRAYAQNFKRKLNS